MPTLQRGNQIYYYRIKIKNNNPKDVVIDLATVPKDLALPLTEG